jgi:ribonuclease P protein component
VAVTALLDVGDGDARVAFAVNRRVGPAVVRNRLRRRLRAAMRELDLSGGAYLVAADPEAVRLEFSELRRHLAAAMGEASA